MTEVACYTSGRKDGVIDHVGKTGSLYKKKSYIFIGHHTLNSKWIKDLNRKGTHRGKLHKC